MSATFRRRAIVAAALLMGACHNVTGPDALLDGPWVLRSLRRSSGVTTTVRGDEFTVDFGSDGRLDVRADCNGCGGTYEVATGRLQVGPLFCTRAFCGATAPLDSEFVSQLQAAQAFSVLVNRLTIVSDEGVLEFERR